MAERQAPELENQSQKSFLPYVIIGGLLVFCIFLRPDLVWQLVAVSVVCAGVIFMLPRNEKLSRSADIAVENQTAQMIAQYHALIDGLQFPVYLLDQNASLKYSNQHAVAAFGPVRVGDRITIRFRQPQLMKTIEEALSQAKAVTTSYNEPVPDDRWFQVEISPVPKTGPERGKHENLFLLAFHDQTEARRIDQMRSDFIANASHELRTPLASLLGYIETMKGPAKDDAAARERFTDVMLDQAERMSRLVNDLLSLSRIEMKSHVKPSDVVNIREVLKAVVATLEGPAQQMNVTISLDVEQDLSVVGDRDELIQVFENLVENACKYGQEGGKVLVTLERSEKPDDSNAVISVRDYGMGIAIEHQHRITERFYRVDVARSREKQGTGLGLAIVKHILNRHGSRLAVKSDLGEGAEFIVQLKLHENVND